MRPRRLCAVPRPNSARSGFLTFTLTALRAAGEGLAHRLGEERSQGRHTYLTFRRSCRMAFRSFALGYREILLASGPAIP